GGDPTLRRRPRRRRGRERERETGRAGRGRAALARLGRPAAAPPAGGARRAGDARQGGPPEADALVRRAARLRPTVVQRRGAAPRGRSRAARRVARAGARPSPPGGEALGDPVRIAVLRPQVPFARGG